MLPLLIILGLLAFGTWAVASLIDSPGDFDIETMVDAIRQVEAWDGRSRGAAGERGYWQITPAVWAQFSSHPFSLAESRSLSGLTYQREAARSYVLWIKRRILDSGMPLSPYSVALVWTAGFDAVRYRRPHAPSKAKVDYANRAQNLYFEIHEENHPAYRSSSR